MATQTGMKKKIRPNRSVIALPRPERSMYSTSTRTCSLTFSRNGAPKKTMTANRYHCSSSQAFEPMLKP